jgi:hypothetical protein
MQHQINFRTEPLIDEMRKAGVLLDTKKLNTYHLQKLLLEFRIAEFNKKQEQAVNKARVLA